MLGLGLLLMVMMSVGPLMVLLLLSRGEHVIPT
jgi:hypothetical protein